VTSAKAVNVGMDFASEGGRDGDDPGDPSPDEAPGPGEEVRTARRWIVAREDRARGDRWPLGWRGPSRRPGQDRLGHDLRGRNRRRRRRDRRAPRRPRIRPGDRQRDAAVQVPDLEIVPPATSS